MKQSLIRISIVIVAATLMLGAPSNPQKPKKTPCANSLADCPDQGCGTDFDPNLNLRKNIRSDTQEPTTRTLTWMKKLDDPEDFSKGDSREELAKLGEGQSIRVVAYLLDVKKEGAESCNCGLTDAPETDNHLVLVSKTTIDKFPLSDDADTNDEIFHSREHESETAEFTPRVRLAHPNFTRGKVRPLIDAAPEEALLVRVTGLLLFDSEHFIRNSLVRVNNWEIHPVLSLEFCMTGTSCKATSNVGWKSLDDIH